MNTLIKSFSCFDILWKIKLMKYPPDTVRDYRD